MKKNKFFGGITFILCLAIVASSVMIPSVFAENIKDTVKPLYPFNISAVGGTNVNISSSDNIFTDEYTKLLEISSNTLKNGIIADLDKVSVSVNGNGNVVTPLVSGTVFGVDSSVEVSAINTASLSGEKGFKVQSSARYEHNGNLATSKSGGYIEYARKQSLVGADGILFYLKTEGANLVNIEIDPNNPENSSRWTYDWDPWLMLKKGAAYSYISLNGSSWTTANAVAREGSDIFGAMQFNSAFEGYVKIPFTSLINDCGFVFDSKLDSFEKIIVRTKGIGGSYGNFAAGPFFVLDKDSSSNTITVNSAEPSDALSTIGGKISGFKEAMSDIQSVLLYVKTDSANRISVKANVDDDYISEMPDMELVPGSEVYLLKNGENTWKQTMVIATETVGAIGFDSAFEGYVKIPVSSFKESNEKIAVLPEIDYVTGFEIEVGGVGGKFGKVAVAPFLMTQDTGKCDFEIDGGYVKPSFDDIEAIPVTKGSFHSAGGTGYAEVNPLTWVNAKGVKITATTETKKVSAIESAMTSFGDYYTVNDTATKFFESDTVIIYVKTDSANELAIKLYDSDWNELFLKAGTTYSYAADGDDEWTQSQMQTVSYGGKNYGVLSFNEAFEGYIKLNLIKNLGTSSDKKFNYMYFYPMALAGQYGSVTVGPIFSVTKDTPSTTINIADEYKPQPIKAKPLTAGNYYSANGGSATKAKLIKPLEWLMVDGMEMTAVEEKSYETAAHSMGNQFGNYFTINDSAATFFTSDTILFYVKTDSANDIAFKIYDKNWSEYFFKANTAYSYATLTDEAWSDATMKTASYNGTDYGVLSFDSAFEGYVKFNLPRNVGVSYSDKFIYMYFYSKSLGGQYGSVHVGPFLSVTEDSISTKINVDREFTVDTVKANPIPDWSISNSSWETISAKLTTPVAWTNVSGIELTAKDGIVYEAADNVQADTAWKDVCANIEPNATFGSETHLIFYVKTEAANVIIPKVYTKWGYLATPKMNATYYYAKTGDTQWSEATFIRSGSEVAGSSYHGSIVFGEAFEGFIKIKLSDLGHNDIGGIVSGHAFDAIYVNYKGLGGAYGDSLTVGPFFVVTKDSESTEIILPEEYRVETENDDIQEQPPVPQPTPPADDIDAPVAERLSNVLKYSQDGSQQGYYFAVGDNTRYHLGYPAYRLVANKLEKDYKVIPSLISSENLTAKVFAETVVDELIAKIDGEGKGAIVDISLGIYDDGDSSSTAGYINTAIAKLKAAKPYVVIVYTTPNLVMDTQQNLKLKEVASKIYEDNSVFEIDVASDVFNEYYTQFYSDSQLPNVSGYRNIAKYIIAKYLGNSFEKIVATDEATITLPEGATLINTDYKVLNSVGISTAKALMKINGEFAYGLTLEGNQAITGKRPYDSGAEILFDLTKAAGGDNCLMFYLDIPDANKIGLVAYKANEKNVNEDFVMLLDNSEFDVLADGQTKWKTLKTVKGSDVEGQLPGALNFDSAFKGWVRIPYKSFGITGSLENGDAVRALVVRVSELGGSYGNVKLGTFATMKRISSAEADILEQFDNVKISLPEGATLVNTNYKILNTVGINTIKISMKVKEESAYGLILSSDKAISGKRPYDSGSEILFDLTKAAGGDNCLMFYLDIPDANKIGLVAYKANEKSVNEDFVMLLDNSEFDVLADGQTKWKTLKTVKGSDVEGQLPGALNFDSAFKGWVRIPYKSFGITGSLENGDAVRALVVRVSELGGSYGNMILGTFATMERPGYVAQNVWDKKDLPEMVPFTNPISVTKYWEAFLEVTPSVTPSLTTEVGAWISCSPTIDKQGQDYMKSWFELYKNYDNMPIGEFTHLMFYVKVPETKENRLSICMFTETGFEYKIMANQPYALLQLGEKEWQHYLAEDVKLNNYGGIILPAGFEGFIKVPMSSLLPATVNSETKLAQICLRFGYIGMNEEACLWGGTFGVTKDNDPGPKELVYTSLPAATTVKKMFAIDKGDIYPDKIMLYWQSLENAVSYDVEAYSVTRVDKGYEYRLVNTETFYTNSGTITGLEMGTSYAILIKAKDALGNVIATYEYVRVKTATENPYVMKTISEEVKLDTVDIQTDETPNGANLGIIPIILICVGGAVVLGGAAVLVIVLVNKKRRKANEIQ